MECSAAMGALPAAFVHHSACVRHGTLQAPCEAIPMEPAPDHIAPRCAVLQAGGGEAVEEEWGAGGHLAQAASSGAVVWVLYC